MSAPVPLLGEALPRASSVGIASLDRDFYGPHLTTAITFINEDVVVCVRRDILTPSESR